MRSQYSEGTYGMDDETNTSYRPHVGMKYKFSQQLTGDIRYEYTYYQTDRKKGDYTRHVISTGLSYTF